MLDGVDDHEVVGENSGVGIGRRVVADLNDPVARHRSGIDPQGELLRATRWLTVVGRRCRCRISQRFGRFRRCRSRRRGRRTAVDGRRDVDRRIVGLEDECGLGNSWEIQVNRRGDRRWIVGAGRGGRAHRVESGDRRQADADGDHRYGPTADDHGIMGVAVHQRSIRIRSESFLEYPTTFAAPAVVLLAAVAVGTVLDRRRDGRLVG